MTHIDERKAQMKTKLVRNVSGRFRRESEERRQLIELQQKICALSGQVRTFHNWRQRRVEDKMQVLTTSLSRRLKRCLLGRRELAVRTSLSAPGRQFQRASSTQDRRPAQSARIDVAGVRHRRRLWASRIRNPAEHARRTPEKANAPRLHPASGRLHVASVVATITF